MTGREVYSLLRDIADDLTLVVDDHIELTDTLRAGDGDTIDIPGEPLQFIIGIAGLKDGDTELSDHDATAPIVAIFHEICGHGGQVLCEFNRKTDLSRILAMNYYACAGSPEYYNGCAERNSFTPQYAAQPHEIAAQYAGLRAARSYLATKFGSDRADTMLLAYTNGRIANKSEFIPAGKYKNLDDVLDTFNRVFKRAADRHHVYASDTKCTDDVLIRFNNKAVMERVTKCRSGLLQDFRMATAYQQLSQQNKEQLNHPVFEGIDMSTRNAFDMFPKWKKPNVKKSSLDQMLDLDTIKAERKTQRSQDGPSIT